MQQIHPVPPFEVSKDERVSVISDLLPTLIPLLEQAVSPTTWQNLPPIRIYNKQREFLSEKLAGVFENFVAMPTLSHPLNPSHISSFHGYLQADSLDGFVPMVISTQRLKGFFKNYGAWGIQSPIVRWADFKEQERFDWLNGVPDGVQLMANWDMYVSNAKKCIVVTEIDHESIQREVLRDEVLIHVLVDAVERLQQFLTPNSSFPFTSNLFYLDEVTND